MTIRSTIKKIFGVHLHGVCGEEDYSLYGLRNSSHGTEQCFGSLSIFLVQNGITRSISGNILLVTFIYYGCKCEKEILEKIQTDIPVYVQDGLACLCGEG